MTKKNLFQELFAKASEYIDDIKSNYAEAHLKRRMEQAYADAEMKAFTAEWSINSYYLEGDIDKINIDTLIERRLDVEDAEKAMLIIASEYKKLFDKEIK